MTLLPIAVALSFTVDPAQVSAGAFYSGATLHVRGSIGEGSQVAVRVIGPREHHRFNRRGRIFGLFWGGIEHVSFQDAPSLYGLYTSAALELLAPRSVRFGLELGTDALEARIGVEGAGAPKTEMIEQLVRLKESEGLYRAAPGSVRLAEAEGGRRGFEASVAVPAAASPGEIEVAVFELAGGAVIASGTAQVQLRRVGAPAFLTRLAREQGTLFGLLAVIALVATGVLVDTFGRRRASRPDPAMVLLLGLARSVDEAVLPARHVPRSAEAVERLRARYKLFRTLLTLNGEVLQLLAELEEESSWTSFRDARLRMPIRALFDGTADMVRVLNELTHDRYFDLANVVASLRTDVWNFLAKSAETDEKRFTLQLGEIRSETAAQAGDKAVGLARVECDLGLSVPGGFVVTVAAYREFLEANGLAGQLRTILAPARLDATGDFERRCRLAQDIVRDAPVPAAVAAAIDEAYRAAGFGSGEALAVRSSAAGEGSELSFAGQFETVLNVNAGELASAWKKVVASRFAPGAVFYRRAAGLAEVDTPMAVLVQRMVRARASGVLFTRRPDDPKAPVLLVAGARGLGPEVSLGIASADEFTVSRAAPHAIVDRRIAPKKTRLAVIDGGAGVARLALAGPEQTQPSMSDDEVARLAAAALSIERYFGTPQDIEWAIDSGGALSILQARPLHVSRPSLEPSRSTDARLLVRGGAPVWPGRAVGPVHVARTREDEERTPPGAVLVVPQLLPDCVPLLPRVSGIVVERGTVTGHAASILREFRVPSLFGVPDALRLLTPGREVSLDAAGCSVFDGAAWPELRGKTAVSVSGEERTGLPALLAGKLTKLNGSAFVGTWACQSLHDVIRFAHEMAIQAMFDTGDRLLDAPAGGVKRLDCPPPLYLHLLDLGGGIRADAASLDHVTPEQVTSAPFGALWRGLGDADFHPRDRRTEPPGTLALGLADEMPAAGRDGLGEPNYACITDTYLNLNTRAGIERDHLRARPRLQAYHYVVVDSFLSEHPDENHISLRMRGGGAAAGQRRLRAQFVAESLRARGFTVKVTGEIVNASLGGVDRTAGTAALTAVGHLLRFLARVDTQMTDSRDVKRYVDSFADAEATALEGREAATG